jgi:hypothetical protein
MIKSSVGPTWPETKQFNPSQRQICFKSLGTGMQRKTDMLTLWGGTYSYCLANLTYMEPEVIGGLRSHSKLLSIYIRFFLHFNGDSNKDIP